MSNEAILFGAGGVVLGALVLLAVTWLWPTPQLRAKPTPARAPRWRYRNY